MKKGILLFSIIVLNTTISFTSSFNDFFFKLDSYLKKGKYISENELFIVGSNGYVMYSPDDGKNWERKLTYLQEFLVSLEFVQFSQTLFVIGENGTLLKSLNKGGKWEKININSKSNLYSISFSDNNGVITGDSGIVMISHDYGETWLKESKFTNSILKHSIIMKDEIFIVNDKSEIFRKKFNQSEWHIQNNNGEIIPNEKSIKVMSYKNSIYILTRNYLLINSDNSDNWLVKSIGWNNQSNMFIFNEDVLSIILTSINGDAHNFFSVLNLDINSINSELVHYTPVFSKDYIVSRSYIEDVFTNDTKNNYFAIGMNGTIIKFDKVKDQWEYISHYCYHDSDYKPISFINDSVGYIGRFDGIVLRTNNFGNTFLSQMKKMPNEGNTLRIIPSNNKEAIRIVNTQGYPLSKTYDGGLNYQQINFRPLINYPIFDFNSNNLVVCGNDQNTIPKGHIIVARQFDSIINYQNVDSCLLIIPKFLNNNDIIICGMKRIGLILDSNNQIIDFGKKKGVIFRSRDLGKSWIESNFSAYTQIYNIYFPTDNIGFAFAEYQLNDSVFFNCLLRSVDSGNSWEVILDSLTFNLQDIYLNPVNGYGLLLDSRGKLWSTENFGMKWLQIIDKDTQEQYEVFNNIAYINKELYITSTSHLYRAYPGKFPTNPVSVKDEIEGGAPPFWIYPPFPNPTKSDINFRILWSKQISLDKIKFALYDVLGTKIMDFHDISANYELENLATIRLEISKGIKGLYYLRANIDGYYKTFPVVIE